MAGDERPSQNHVFDSTTMPRKIGWGGVPRRWLELLRRLSLAKIKKKKQSSSSLCQVTWELKVTNERTGLAGMGIVGGWTSLGLGADIPVALREAWPHRGFRWRLRGRGQIVWAQCQTGVVRPERCVCVGRNKEEWQQRTYVTRCCALGEIAEEVMIGALMDYLSSV